MKYHKQRLQGGSSDARADQNIERRGEEVA